jgi:hypothetical protein
LTVGGGVKDALRIHSASARLTTSPDSSAVRSCGGRVGLLHRRVLYGSDVHDATGFVGPYVRRASGELVTWNRDNVLEKVRGVPVDATAIAYSADGDPSDGATCVVVAREVRCAGQNRFGELGNRDHATAA